MNSRGFTLVETLIYLAIVGLVVTALVQFGLSVSDTRYRNYLAQEVNANARSGMSIVSQKIREAAAINTSTSVFGTDPGTLSLEMADAQVNPTIFTLSGNDGSLQMQEGASAVQTITSAEVRVLNMVFRDLTASSTRENIRIEMTMTGPADEFHYTKTVTSTVSIR